MVQLNLIQQTLLLIQSTIRLLLGFYQKLSIARCVMLAVVMPEWQP